MVGIASQLWRRLAVGRCVEVELLVDERQRRPPATPRTSPVWSQRLADDDRQPGNWWNVAIQPSSPTPVKSLHVNTNFTDVEMHANSIVMTHGYTVGYA